MQDNKVTFKICRISLLLLISSKFAKILHYCMYCYLLTLVKPLYWSHSGQSQQFLNSYKTDVFFPQNQQLTLTGNLGLQMESQTLTMVYILNEQLKHEKRKHSIHILKHCL